MHPKQFALFMGIAMAVVGLLAFFPSLNVLPAAGMPALTVDSSYGLFLGYVPMNVLNKIVLIALGAVGIAVSMAPATALPSSIRWSRVVFVVSGILAILGLFPQTDTLFGYMPLYGWNVVVSAAIAILGAYFGYALSSRVPEQPPVPKQAHVAGVR